MSDAYERERQNNSRLSELSAKVTALRDVTVDIYDNARAQDVIDNTVCVHAITCGCKGLEGQEGGFGLIDL
jgi:blocked-early-in-transport protein 1